MKIMELTRDAVRCAIAGCAAIVVYAGAFAVDTHDYSTYVKLKVNTSLAYTVGGWPGSDKWNPAGAMSNSVCYLVPSGKTLTTNTNTGNDKNTGEPYPAGGTWPCQGCRRASPPGGRSRSAA